MEAHNMYLSHCSEAEDLLDPPHIDLSKEDFEKFNEKYGFTDQQIKQFLEAFSVFDRDCDGLISSRELGAVMTGLGHRPSLQELEALIRAVDTDKDGCVNFAEFLQMISAKMDGDAQPEHELQEVFSVMDVNEDGVISVPDLHQVLSKMGENISQEEVEEMVKAADINTDGVVDFSEFKQILHAK